MLFYITKASDYDGTKVEEKRINSLDELLDFTQKTEKKSIIIEYLNGEYEIFGWHIIDYDTWVE